MAGSSVKPLPDPASRYDSRQDAARPAAPLQPPRPPLDTKRDRSAVRHRRHHSWVALPRDTRRDAKVRGLPDELLPVELAHARRREREVTANKARRSWKAYAEAVEAEIQRRESVRRRS
jgi:hypothetical protein